MKILVCLGFFCRRSLYNSAYWYFCVFVWLCSLASNLSVCGCEGVMACLNTPLHASGHYCLSSQTSLLVCPKNTALLHGPLSPCRAPRGPLVWDMLASTNTAGPTQNHWALSKSWEANICCLEQLRFVWILLYFTLFCSFCIQSWSVCKGYCIKCNCRNDWILG